MSLSPEDDLSAAEFALGTLDPGERAALAARRQREPELDAAIRAWEARLSPLAEAAPPIEPPHDYLPAIQARLRVTSPPTSGAEDAVARLQARLARWRAGAVAASAVAAMLAIGILVRVSTEVAAPHEFVAVLQKSADAPAFAISVNIDTREFTVRPVAASAPVGKSYELWIIDARLGPPRSLGVIDPDKLTRANRLSPYDPAVVTDATYAVTVEPPGGSPDGKPSGPPVFVGKLIPVGP